MSAPLWILCALVAVTMIVGAAIGIWRLICWLAVLMVGWFFAAL